VPTESLLVRGEETVREEKVKLDVSWEFWGGKRKGRGGR